jgi:hypothetical protein
MLKNLLAYIWTKTLCYYENLSKISPPPGVDVNGAKTVKNALDANYYLDVYI